MEPTNEQELPLAPVDPLGDGIIVPDTPEEKKEEGK